MKRKNTNRRILVVRTDRVGDVVLATPLIRSLRQTFPDAFLAALVRPYTSSVLSNNIHLDAVILDDYENNDRGFKGFLRKTREIRRYRFDTALMLLPTQRAAWILFLAGIRLRIGVGRKIYESLTFTRTVSRNKYNPLRHEADYCMDLGRIIGVKSNNLKPEIFLTDEERLWGRKVLSKKGINSGDRIVGIHPGSGNSSSNWPGEKYAELANTILKESELKIVITGDPSEKELTESINLYTKGKTLDLTGEFNLRELISIIGNFDLLISSSTGPMHIAAALDVPTVSLFCNLTACSPKLWGPIGNEHEILVPAVDFCSGCDQKTKCCLEGIEVQQVYNAAEVLLEKQTLRLV